MDPTLLGVIIGSSLTIFGNFFSHLFNYIKDEKRWTKQQLIEQHNQMRMDQKEKWEIFNNCLNSLSLLGYHKQNSEDLKLQDEELLGLFRDAHKWLTLFATNLDDSYHAETRKEFYSEFRYFYLTSNIYAIERLHDLVMKLVIDDRELFTKENRYSDDSNGRKLEFLIDNEFRRKMFINGVQLPSLYETTVSLSDFTPNQRMKLWDIYFDKTKDVPPNKIQLRLPKLNTQKNSVELWGNKWSASINPFDMKPSEILLEWEKSFEEALNQVEKEYHIHNNDSEKIDQNSS